MMKKPAMQLNLLNLTSNVSAMATTEYTNTDERSVVLFRQDAPQV